MTDGPDGPAAGHGEPDDREPLGDPVASPAQRAIGRGIDLLVIATFTMAVFLPTASISGGEVTLPTWVHVAILASWVAYETAMVAVVGTTVGKMAVGCRVADRRTGGKPPWVRALLRAAPVPTLLPVVSFLALAVYPTLLLDPAERRGLADRLSSTVVVQGPGRRPPR